MVLIESLINKMNAISGIPETSEFKGYIESSDVKLNTEFFDSASARDIKNDEEMLRASIAAEQDASSLYRQYAKKTSNKKIKDVMLSVADEEDVHIGEFQQTLETLNEDYLSRINDGKEEVLEENNKIDAYEFFIGSLVELENSETLFEAMNKAIENLNSNSNYYIENKNEIKMEYQTPGGSGINVARMIKNMSKVHVPKFDTKRNMSDRLKTMFKMPTPKDDMNAANSNRESFPMKEKTVVGEIKEKPVAGTPNVAPELPEPEIIETKGLDNGNFSVVGAFADEKDAAMVLKNLLIKKRNAKMGQTKDGRFEVTVEENFIKATPENGLGHVEGGVEYEVKREDNTIGNSGAVIGTVIPNKKKE